LSTRPDHLLTDNRYQPAPITIYDLVANFSSQYKIYLTIDNHGNLIRYLIHFRPSAKMFFC
ncbi:MAG TPA: hypothetical protein DDZ60_05120, partial [Planktothrix sp. UBA10369]|nr:hypothetical protein [Planktothrix sp. UBA10369]